MEKYFDMLNTTRFHNNLFKELKPLSNKIIELQDKIYHLKYEIQNKNFNFLFYLFLIIIILSIILFINVSGVAFFLFLFTSPITIILPIGYIYANSSQTIQLEKKIKEELKAENNNYENEVKKIYESVFQVNTINIDIIKYVGGNPYINDLINYEGISFPSAFFVYLENNDNLILIHSYSYKNNCVGKFEIPLIDIIAFANANEFHPKTQNKDGGNDKQKGLIKENKSKKNSINNSKKDKKNPKRTTIDNQNTILKIRTEGSTEELIFSSSAYEIFNKLMPSKKLTLNEYEIKAPDTKECPYCAETIKFKAIICRFCNNNLSE